MVDDDADPGYGYGDDQSAAELNVNREAAEQVQAAQVHSVAASEI